MIRIVADLGNSRLKWGRLDASGRLGDVRACPADDPSSWESAWDEGESPATPGATWAVSTVNPPAAERLDAMLRGRGVSRISWYRSAADVRIDHRLATPATTGADRALAVAAAVAEGPRGRPGLVVLCGTAVTVERVSAEGSWHGGAITAGLGLLSRALHAGTAQLPEVAPAAAPPAWGVATREALEAGIFWGVVGAIRELATRQAEAIGPAPWLVWSGGDAEVLAPALAWPGGRVVADLVLRGLAGQAFGRHAGGTHES